MLQTAAIHFRMVTPHWFKMLKIIVLESIQARLVIRPKDQGVESSQIYKEAENLYREIKKDMRTKGMVH